MKIRRNLLPFFILREGAAVPRTKRSNPRGGDDFVSSGGAATPRRPDGCAWQDAVCHIFFPRRYLRAKFMPFGRVALFCPREPNCACQRPARLDHKGHQVPAYRQAGTKERGSKAGYLKSSVSFTPPDGIGTFGFVFFVSLVVQMNRDRCPFLPLTVKNR